MIRALSDRLTCGPCATGCASAFSKLLHPFATRAANGARFSCDGKTQARQHRWLGVALGLMFVLSARSLRAGDIHRAVERNDLKAIQALIAKDPQVVGARDSTQRTPLHLAAQYGNLELVTYLLAHGADVKARAENEFTPLHVTDDPEIARLLIKNGADPKAKSAHGSMLRLAVQDKNLGMIELLVQMGEKLSFEQLVELGYTDQVAALLKEQPWLAKAPRRCLHTAAGKGNLEIVRLLLDHGADPNQDYGPVANRQGPGTPLSFTGRYDIAKLLCERGADVNLGGGLLYNGTSRSAVYDSDSHYMQLLLDHGADVSLRDPYESMTALHATANDGDVEKCILLLRYHADVGARTRDGMTALMFAVAQKHDKVCELLLQHGAHLDIHVATALGQSAKVREMLSKTPELARQRDLRMHRTPLFYAAERGRLELVELLIQHKANVNARAVPREDLGYTLSGYVVREFNATNETEIGETPLHVAAAAGQTAVVRLLIQHGADINASSKSGGTALFAAVRSKHVDIVRLLVEHGAELDVDGMESPLIFATDNVEITRLLLSGNPAPEAISEALRRAADESPMVAELLLTKGAKADIFTASTLGKLDRVAELLAGEPELVRQFQSDYPNLQPLTLAAKHGHLKVVEFLLSKGAEIEPEAGTTPLEEAAGSGQAEVVKLLLDRGADINHKGSTGRDALCEAVLGGNPKTVELLISRGAQVMARDIRQGTALHEAARMGQLESARLLVKAGVPVDVLDSFRETPLYIAAENASTEVAAFLLQAGADVNSRNRRGETPLTSAQQPRFPRYGVVPADRDIESMVKLLRAHGGMK